MEAIDNSAVFCLDLVHQIYNFHRVFLVNKKWF